MDKEKTIESLNKLVEINNDRIEGYEKAYENTEEKELKSLFLKFEQTSKECLDELKNEIKKLGGKETEGSTSSGSFFRVWMKIKTALTGKDRKTILNSCEFGEENVVKVYNNVLDDSLEYLNLHQQEMIKKQYNLLKSDQSTIKSMQNNLLVAQ